MKNLKKWPEFINDNALLNLKEVVEILPIHRKTFLMWIRKGEFPQPESFCNNSSPSSWHKRLSLIPSKVGEGSGKKFYWRAKKIKEINDKFWAKKILIKKNGSLIFGINKD